MRDHTKLKVFSIADRLVLSVYKHTGGFPEAERYGLQADAPIGSFCSSNIVEGCARSTQAEYVRFLEIAYGSARELQYEIDVSKRLGFLRPAQSEQLFDECISLSKALNGLLRSLRSP